MVLIIFNVAQLSTFPCVLNSNCNKRHLEKKKKSLDIITLRHDHDHVKRVSVYIVREVSRHYS